MIYHDQNKEDSRMLNDLENSDKELRARDSFEREDSMFDPCTIHEVMIPNDTTFRQSERMLNDTTFRRSEYGTSLFQTGIHLSRIDSQTGYDDYDPRDLEPPEEIYVSHDIGTIQRARLVPESTLVSDSTPKIPTKSSPKTLKAITILQDARGKVLWENPYNSLAYWFLCDVIDYITMGKL